MALALPLFLTELLEQVPNFSKLFSNHLRSKAALVRHHDQFDGDQEYTGFQQ